MNKFSEPALDTASLDRAVREVTSRLSRSLILGEWISVSCGFSWCRTISAIRSRYRQITEKAND